MVICHVSISGQVAENNNICVAIANFNKLIFKEHVINMKAQNPIRIASFTFLKVTSINVVLQL